MIVRILRSQSVAVCVSSSRTTNNTVVRVARFVRGFRCVNKERVCVHRHTRRFVVVDVSIPVSMYPTVAAAERHVSKAKSVLRASVKSNVPNPPRPFVVRNVSM